MDRRRLALLIALTAAIAAFFIFDLKQYVSLDYFHASRARFEAYRDAHSLQAAALFFTMYVAVTALSLPGATVMTLIAGALFGWAVGVVLVSFASTIGATLAFLSARWIVGGWVQTRFADHLERVNAGIAREGAYYLFALRLVPLFPFFVVNIVMGLTRIRTTTFYWVSQLGMLPATVVYVYAGTQFDQTMITPGLIFALALIGLFPLVVKEAHDAIKTRRVYARWTGRRPSRYDYNVVVIGAGSAGLVSAYIAAATRARVALVEKHRMGGDCLNTGCVPSKALLRSARLLSHIARAQEFGIARASAQFSFADVMQRVSEVVKTVAPHDSVERYRALGVDCIAGAAKITSPWTVEVGTATGRTTLATKSIVIAAGARPVVPPIPGLQEVGFLTSDTVWNLRELPQRLVVLGGGPVGAELAQAFARLGSRVTQVELLPRLLAREDAEVSALVQARFEAEGIRVLTGHRARQFLLEGGERILVAEHDGREVRIPFDQVLVALGRVANTEGYGLEELGLHFTPARTIETDIHMQTHYPNIFACGDVTGPYQFTHVAAFQAWYATVNALFGSFRRFRADDRAIPWTTFTEPEVARVGLNEQEARDRGVAHVVTVWRIDELDRAIAEGEAHGFVKVLTKPGTDHILGATIVGERAGDLLAEFVLAMKHDLGLNKILATVHAYPTFAEASKYAAGAWKRSTVTRGQWTFLEAFHAWRRGAGGFGAVLGALRPLRRDRRPAYAADEPQ
jgi:pyruvate/2-oxoglutarate dehydrogenase complex dihydrolipoamide dehydrogenase (E3) component/uncharacterized membrane protein YdjX (TVP38/TMEM64 family)